MTAELVETATTKAGLLENLVPKPRKGDVIPINRGRREDNQASGETVAKDKAPVGYIAWPPEIFQVMAALNTSAPANVRVTSIHTGFIAFEGTDILQNILPGRSGEKPGTVSEVTVFSEDNRHTGRWSRTRMLAERNRRSRIASGVLHETRGRRPRAKLSR